MTDQELSILQSEDPAELKAVIARLPVPRHIAFIMDGNGRWARARRLERFKGHAAGSRIIRSLITNCSHIGVEALTLYCFSTENWRRPMAEINFLMELIRGFLEREALDMKREGVQLRHMGDLEPLPAKVRAEILRVEELTKDCDVIVLNLAVNYGGRQEIALAARRLAEEVRDGVRTAESVDMACFGSYLQSGDLPDPDLVIRTSGEQRLSNFLLWQSAYSEMYFTDVNWPDFDELALYRAVLTYQHRDRRFGGIDKGE